METVVKVIQTNEPDTLKRLKEIEKEAFGEGGMNEWMLVPLIRHGKVFGLYYEGDLIGGAQFMRDWEFPQRAYLVGVAVDAAYRGKGLGTLFLQEALGHLKKEGIQKVELTVDPTNIGAVSVYHDKLGFTTKSQRQDEYGPGQSRLVMEVDVTPLFM